MRTPTRTPAAFALLVTVVAGCTTLAPATPHPEKSRYTMPPPTPTMTAIATVAPRGAGRPYKPADIAAMFEDTIANRPAAIGERLRTRAAIAAIANVVADEVYSFDGRPYQKVFFQGRCPEAPDPCDLFFEGISAFNPDAGDGYDFSVKPEVPLVTLTSRGLGGLPADLKDSLDALARSLATKSQIGHRMLVSVGWVLPPAQDTYVLKYNYGLGEGDPTVVVTLDGTARQILSIKMQP